jgi:Flp pilus assembly protein CpaB
MVDLDTPTLPLTVPPDPGSSSRVLRRRRTLPGGRAVAGGLLVAVAGVGVFTAYDAAAEGPTSAYAVVTADIDAGDTLSTDDLAVVAVDLPPAQRRRSFTDVDLLAGATALGPLDAGQLVQSSDVAKPLGGSGLASISIPVESARALNGELQRGDRVDVIVTTTAGGTPETDTVSTAALVVDALAGDVALGGSGEVTVELAVPPEDLEAVAQAGAAGTVTLARTTGVSS